jgi:hypothetical protein
MFRGLPGVFREHPALGPGHPGTDLILQAMFQRLAAVCREHPARCR